MRFARVTAVKNGARLRGGKITGTCLDLPEVGRRFVVYSQALEEDEPGMLRAFGTSTVMEINSPEQDVYLITTRNSVYRVVISEYNSPLH